MRRAITGTPIVAMTMAALIVATAEPAAAHYTYVYQGNDFMSINSSHTTATVCDRENDGHAVYGDVIDEFGRRFRVYDTYNSSCTSSEPNFARIMDFRLCEELSGTDACTSWRFA